MTIQVSFLSGQGLKQVMANFNNGILVDAEML